MHNAFLKYLHFQRKFFSNAMQGSRDTHKNSLLKKTETHQCLHLLGIAGLVVKYPSTNFLGNREVIYGRAKRSNGQLQTHTFRQN